MPIPLKSLPLLYVFEWRGGGAVNIFPSRLQRFVWFVIRGMILLPEGINIVDTKHTRVTCHVKYNMHALKTDFFFICQNTFLYTIEVCGLIL